MTDPTPTEDLPGYLAVVLTFRRPESLLTVVASVCQQDLPPTRIVVVDNDPNQSAERSVAEFDAGAIPVTYVATGVNLGPAGGWAHGVKAARSMSDRGEWVAIFDDDDPLNGTSTMRELMVHARDAPPTVAAVGLRGAQLGRWALLSRVQRPGKRVDYLASSGAPLYRWRAVDAVGFFAPDLFFGFEDLDLGLRLQQRGRTLSVAFEAQEGAVRGTAPTRTPWREYYKTRALVVICRRHIGLFATIATVMRALILAAPLFIGRRDGIELVKARWQGARDGLAGRLGPGRHAPESNPVKPQ